ncbi:uncharacterized protein LOC113484408 [Athene cunicularia]|uniref:uncharacterized protein LOC113484408 n=1 Tax=Athene cunicularia TaxID=194338 RepID=UPI000EF707A4|nr:uncharacterized protein LOC113484408 [Athene cunicularia]
MQKNGKKQNEGGVEMNESSACPIFTNVNNASMGTCTCRVENMTNVSENRHSDQNKHGTVSQPKESVITMKCSFKIWLENPVVHVKWYKNPCLEVRNQTNTTALGKNCTNLTMCAASTEICGFRMFIRRINLTDTGHGPQGTVPSCGPSQTNVTKVEACTGLKFFTCIIFGLAAGTFLYMPIIGLMLWQCRRNSKGKLSSRQVATENQLGMAAPVTGTEDLTYANLKFEKKETKPASSDVVYTEIKPSQQQQSAEDAGAANAGVDVSTEGEGK